MSEQKNFESTSALTRIRLDSDVNTIDLLQFDQINKRAHTSFNISVNSIVNDEVKSKNLEKLTTQMKSIFKGLKLDSIAT
jgi:hypothetical protein